MHEYPVSIFRFTDLGTISRYARLCTRGKGDPIARRSEQANSKELVPTLVHELRRISKPLKPRSVTRGWESQGYPG